jgi:hypothetical protein
MSEAATIVLPNRYFSLRRSRAGGNPARPKLDSRLRGNDNAFIRGTAMPSVGETSSLCL